MAASTNDFPTMRARLTETRGADSLRRQVEFTAAGESKVLWWTFTGSNLPSPLARSDVAAVALIYRAMRDKTNLHIEGAVSRDLLDRLDQFQDIWSLWRHDLYTKVRVSADEEVDMPRRATGRLASAICAFSGGVDGTATIWRHHSGQAGRVNRRLLAGVLVRGFDIPLNNDPAWDVAVTTARLALDDIGVPLVLASTNWKTDVCSSWEMEFACGVLATLAHWDEDVGTLLFGSCEEYTRLVTPWGSHPLPTQLLCGQDTVAIYDAGDMSRTQKVALISQWPAGYATLRVCWQGEVTGKNCGVCEKCIRTKLNAIASGVPIPASLGSPPTPAQIMAIKRYNTGQRALMEEILAEAAINGIQNPLIEAARHSLRNARNHARISKAKGVMKTLLGRA